MGGFKRCCNQSPTGTYEPVFIASEALEDVGEKLDRESDGGF